MKRVFALCALVGCGGLPDQQAAVLEGFEYGWVGLNHRLSAVAVDVAVDHTDVVVVGGTSTTGEVPPTPADTCDPASCQEFPVPDSADVEVWWAVVDSAKTAYVPVTVTLEVGRDGASTTAEVTLPNGAKGEGSAILSGFSLSTQHELADGPSCYDPRYGWHPRQITIALGDVVVDGDKATVPVEATFSAGKTFDPDRVCIDEVNDQAIVDLSVTVLVVVGKGAVETQPLTVEATYPFSGDKSHPEEQDVPAPTELSWTITDPLLGFKAIDFRFDPDRTDDRGAYLRTFGFWAKPDGTANAFATNYSPGSQLQDFGFHFDGDVVAIEHLGTVERGSSTGTFPAALDETGEPIVQTLDH